MASGHDPSTQAASFEPGDVGFIIISSAMALFMVPGLAFLYSGLARRKSALSMVWAVMCSSSVVLVQWYLCGYSLALSGTATNSFIGNLDNVGLRNVLAGPSPSNAAVPELVFSMYQGMFCCVTAAIVAGSIAERGRVIPMMVFLFFWATFVYCPIAHWVWGHHGWALRWGVLDYAGGGPVEICSGMTALAYSVVLGKRQDRMMLNFRPHNVSLITLGTIILWFGWLGFNGGSAMGANLRAVMACWNSNLSAAFAAISWVLLDWRLARKWSMVGWCSGTISGLVAATPASGYIPAWASVVLGIVTGVVCNYATKVKFWIHIDDSVDVFAEHGVAGIVGLLFNAVFGVGYIVALDGVSDPSTPVGWLDGNWKQAYKQVGFIGASAGYSFVVSIVLAFAIDRIPGLELRASEAAELVGIDDDQLGQFAYDYVEVRRDYLAWTPAKVDPDSAEFSIPARDRHGIGLHSRMAGPPSPSDETVTGSVPESVPEKVEVSVSVPAEAMAVEEVEAVEDSEKP